MSAISEQSKVYYTMLQSSQRLAQTSKQMTLQPKTPTNTDRGSAVDANGNFKYGHQASLCHLHSKSFYRAGAGADVCAGRANAAVSSRELGVT